MMHNLNSFSLIVDLLLSRHSIYISDMPWTIILGERRTNPRPAEWKHSTGGAHSPPA